MAVTGYSSHTSDVYQQAWGSLTTDSTIVDGNSATGPDLTTSPPANITAAVDLGGTFLISQIASTLGWAWALTHIVETSLDHSSWTPVSSTTPGSHSGSFSTAVETLSGLSILAAYVRVSAADDGNSGATSGHVSIRGIDVTFGSAPARRPATASFL